MHFENSRYKALDETALFGCACRHEFPHKFINLKHGERKVKNCGCAFYVILLLFRLGYAVWMLDKILQANRTSNYKIYVMYDIACSLYRHLNVSVKSLVYSTSEYDS